MTLKSIFALSLVASATAFSVAQAPLDPHANETKAERDARMKWWREARFGMFIHWGLYSVPAGEYEGRQIGSIGEWIMRTANIPVDTYQAYAKQFNPVKFNADQWVSYAKAAGMKYIVMTAKHHEGFAMFNTKVDDWSIAGRTPFKRDPIAEMSAACKRAGIKFGVYYSQNLDWNHPGGGTAGKSWDPKQEGSFHDYVMKVSAPQVKELLTNYKPAVLWWDINANFTPDEVRALTASFPAVPNLIANNRLGGGVPGDTETPEQYIPPTGYKGRDWETCMTMNDTWGFKKNDLNFKSTTTLVRNLIDIASKGGNYLLNVGPTSEGIIPEPEVERLKAVGKWMDKNGHSVYATSASPYRKLPFEGRATVRGNSLFLNVFTWPENGLVLPGLKTAIRSIHAVATGEKLAFSKTSDGSYMISKPTVVDPISTAIELKLTGEPVVEQTEVATTITVDKGAFNLKASDAEIQGTIQLEGGDDSNLGYWTDPQDVPTWNVTVGADSLAPLVASLDYACESGSEGSTVVLRVDGKNTQVQATIGKTGGWHDYVHVILPNQLKLTPGKHKIELVPTHKPGLAVMNLRKLTLSYLH